MESGAEASSAVTPGRKAYWIFHGAVWLRPPAAAAWKVQEVAAPDSILRGMESGRSLWDRKSAGRARSGQKEARIVVDAGVRAHIQWMSA